MGADFELKLQDKAVRRALDRMARNSKDRRKPMRTIARGLYNITTDAFENEQDPWGNAWEPLTEDYVQRPKDEGGRGGDAHPILNRSGSAGLFGSLSRNSDNDSAQVGFGKLYAAIHHLGGEDDMAPGPAAIPARPSLPIDGDGNVAPVAIDLILNTVSEHLGF